MVQTPRSLLLLLGTAALAACAETAPRGPEIVRVEPAEAAPGDVVLVWGRGFGEGLGETDAVALGGRAMALEDAWTDDRLRVRVPRDAPGGATWLVVRAGAGVSKPAPFVVVGGAPPRDATLTPDAGGLDAGPPPADGGVPYDLTFSPDPVAEDQVRLLPGPPVEGRLALEVHLPADAPVWGVAFHLAYDPGLLAFTDADVGDASRAVVREVAPGRLVFGRVVGGTPGPAATLRFSLRGTGQARVDFPRRHRALRDDQNRALPASGWAGGSVEVRAR